RGDRPPARRPGHPLAGEVRSASIAHRSAKTGSCARSQSSSKTNRDRIVRAEELMSSDPSTSYFVQLVDFCAYALLRMEKPIPSRTKFGYDKMYEILRPVCVQECNRKDPRKLGIIR